MARWVSARKSVVQVGGVTAYAPGAMRCIFRGQRDENSYRPGRPLDDCVLCGHAVDASAHQYRSSRVCSPPNCSASWSSSTASGRASPC